MENVSNPANVPTKEKAERQRIPMSLPVQKLATPELPGYHLHWMRGDAARIAQAQAAGYEYVEQDEVNMNRIGLGDGDNSSGHTDLGSRVSIIGGSEGGAVMRLYLMKLRQEWWDSDQEVQAKNSDRIAEQIRGDKGFQSPDGMENRYGKPENKHIFTKRKV